MNVPRRENPCEVLFIKTCRKPGNQAAEAVQQKVAAEGEASLKDVESAGVIGKVFKTFMGKIVKAVETQVLDVRGVGVRIRRAVMRRDDPNLCAGACDATDFRHNAHRVRLVFEKMAKVNAAGARIGEGPGEMRELREHVSGGAGLPVHSDRVRFLFLLAAAEIEGQHGMRSGGKVLNHLACGSPPSITDGIMGWFAGGDTGTIT